MLEPARSTIYSLDYVVMVPSCGLGRRGAGSGFMVGAVGVQLNTRGGLAGWEPRVGAGQGGITVPRECWLGKLDLKTVFLSTLS